MSKRIKFILLTCVFGLIICFVAISLNNKEKNKDAKTESEVIEAEDIGIEEVKDEEKEIKDVEPKVKKEAEKEKTEEKIEETEEPKKKVEEEKEESNLVSLGKFKLTAYCSCSKCCGKWAGSPTASGVMPRANHTIAVDTSVIPFGTKVVINGNTYVAEDTGSAIKGNKIDVFFDSHSKALNFGVQYAEVFVVR